MKVEKKKIKNKGNMPCKKPGKKRMNKNIEQEMATCSLVHRKILNILNDAHRGDICVSRER
jgi:hypothetical protein